MKNGNITVRLTVLVTPFRPTRHAIHERRSYEVLKSLTWKKLCSNRELFDKIKSELYTMIASIVINNLYGLRVY